MKRERKKEREMKRERKNNNIYTMIYIIRINNLT